MERLMSVLKERDDLTTNEVQDLIEKRFAVRFTQKHVRTILRKLGLKYAKPYQHDYRRPKNAEDDLKKLRYHKHGRSDHRFPG
jgi:putative transposase